MACIKIHSRNANHSVYNFCLVHTMENILETLCSTNTNDFLFEIRFNNEHEFIIKINEIIKNDTSFVSLLKNNFDNN